MLPQIIRRGRAYELLHLGDPISEVEAVVDAETIASGAPLTLRSCEAIVGRGTFPVRERWA